MKCMNNIGLWEMLQNKPNNIKKSNINENIKYDK